MTDNSFRYDISETKECFICYIKAVDSSAHLNGNNLTPD